MSGLFITFEGGEGAGKTSLISRLENFLKEQSISSVKTREPGGCRLSESVRELLLAREEDLVIGQRAELMLFLAARVQHMDELILPALKQGKVVLCDRFHDSSIAYQGCARGLGMDFVEDLCLASCYNQWPHLTFLLDVDPKVGLERARMTDKAEASLGLIDRIESEVLKFHEDVRKGYLKLSKKYPKRYRLLDANTPAESVYEQVSQALISYLKGTSDCG